MELLSNLEVLVLYENCIRIIPPQVGSMSSITKLNLHANLITELPRELS